MSSSGIYFDHVWKKFHLGEMHDSLRDLIPATLRKLTGRERKLDLQEGDFWAIRNVAFEVLPGQTLGIIGPNGSGKSTTLKLLTRIYQPTRGRCRLSGRLGALIEISAGFHGDLTGRENIFLQGAIMGMSARDIRRKFDEIVEFSGISEFIETPVKRYSSGMNARLGFAIAAHLEPEVLIIDEVLSVGDMMFQDRAYGRIRDLARSGIPVVLVSHQLDRIAELCTTTLLLHKGEVVAQGLPADVIGAYIRRNHSEPSSEGQACVEFGETELLHEGEVLSGEHITVRIRGRVVAPPPENVEPLVVQLRSLRTGGVIYTTTSKRLGLTLQPNAPFDLRLRLQCNLPPGAFALEILTFDSLAKRALAHAPGIMLQISNEVNFHGHAQLNATIEPGGVGLRAS